MVARGTRCGRVRLMGFLQARLNLLQPSLQREEVVRAGAILKHLLDVLQPVIERLSRGAQVGLGHSRGPMPGSNGIGFCSTKSGIALASWSIWIATVGASVWPISPSIRSSVGPSCAWRLVKVNSRRSGP